ncbi:MAG: hypothetical protein ACOCRZ_00915 [Halothermotrichaceae bacterium]
MDFFKKLEDKLAHKTELLEDMIEKTEDFYGLISDRLPEVEEDVDKTITETEKLVNFFINNENVQQESLMIAEVIKRIKTEINDLYQALSGREELLTELEGFIDKDSENSQTRFVEIFNLIKELKSVLTQLKVLSINANVFSFNNIKEGSAFRVITTEISSTSEKVKNKYNQVEQYIKNLQEWYQNFNDEIDILIEQEAKITVKYKDVDSHFQELLTLLKDTAVNLKNNLTNIKEAVQPIYEILVLIQKQDIIRQNIENLREILKINIDEIRQRSVNCSSDVELLNLISFIEESTRLSKELINNIKNQLKESLFSIESHFRNTKNDLHKIRIDLEGITNIQGYGSFIDKIFSEIFQFLPKLNNELNNFENSYQQIIKKQDTFWANMKGIRSGFKEISVIAGNIQKIKILAKIEFSRIDSGYKFIEDIEKAIDNFIETSIHSEEYSSDLNQELAVSLKKFMELSQQNKKHLNQSQQMLSSTNDDLNTIKELTSSSIESVQSSLTGLINEITYITNEMEKCRSLEETCEDLINTFDDMKEGLSQKKKGYLDKVQLEKWVTDNDKFQQILEKFTSYLERKTASMEFDDIDLDIGQESGEMILF